MGQLKFAASLMLLALFVVAIISFADYFSTDNNTPVSIRDDQAVYNQLNSINQSLELFADGVNQTMVDYGSSDFSSGADASSAAQALKADSIDYINLTKGSIETAFRSTTGGDSRFEIFFYTTLVFITLSVILYSWAALKGGIVE